jgi:SAM-dependent methyltransferase
MRPERFHERATVIQGWRRPVDWPYIRISPNEDKVGSPVFSESARWYDRFQAAKDYAAEAQRVTELIRHIQPRARTLLDVACGTGPHLRYFREDFACHGLDLDDGLLEVARQRLPDVPLTRADMTGFDLAQRFDAVTCLFSSIGYTASVAGLRAAARAMAEHLNPGGVLIIEPWILPEAWAPLNGTSHVDMLQDGTMTLVRVRTNRRSGRMTELFMHYVVAGEGRITTADERHRLCLFTQAEYLEAAEAAGLPARWDDEGITGRGLLIAVRPAGSGARVPDPGERVSDPGERG